MSRRINLIPMAGEGQRFRDAGYHTPKPLIQVGERPMILRAAQSLPPCDEWIFICQSGVAENPAVSSLFKMHFNPFRIIPVNGLTDGQACTCLLARDVLRDDDFLNIGACDNGMIWDPSAFENIYDDSSVDAWIWTFRNNPAVLQDPCMYGWVRVDASNVVEQVSVKVPISKTPMRDHAVIGSFSFRRAADFVRCGDALIAQDRKVNNEFYVDELMNVAVEEGLKVKVFEVDRYICWGTPQDLDVFHYWQAYFEKAGLG